ncbi:22799_t:CDS:2 [Rhizophagus irregularis]|nr:22799_t:CDS:2 [Rhizophagus irregularis]
MYTINSPNKQLGCGITLINSRTAVIHKIVVLRTKESSLNLDLKPQVNNTNINKPNNRRMLAIKW